MCGSINKAFQWAFYDAVLLRRPEDICIIASSSGSIREINLSKLNFSQLLAITRLIFNKLFSHRAVWRHPKERPWFFHSVLFSHRVCLPWNFTRSLPVLRFRTSSNSDHLSRSIFVVLGYFNLAFILYPVLCPRKGLTSSSTLRDWLHFVVFVNLAD